MKRTEIKYEEHDRFIKITGIENVASDHDIENEFGAKAAAAYLGGGVPYYITTRNTAGEYEGVHMCDGVVYFAVYPGDRVTKEKFSKIISILKASGKRLTEIAKETSSEKTILI